jgi:hypothetical protein
VNSIFQDRIHQRLITHMAIKQAALDLGWNLRIEKRDHKDVTPVFQSVFDGRVKRSKALLYAVQRDDHSADVLVSTEVGPKALGNLR